MNKKFFVKIVSLILSLSVFLSVSACDLIGLGGSTCSHLVTTETIKKQASCKEEGEVLVSCLTCKKEQIKSIPKTAHSFSAPTVTKNSTCAEEGVSTRKCTVCGYEENTPIGKVSHTPKTEFLSDKNSHWKECKDCGAKTQVNSHVFVDDENKGVKICLQCLFEKPIGESGGVYGDLDISFHFMKLGNEYAGDCIYVKAGETDILIDAGSRTSSITFIADYLNDFVTDGKLEYVIATHADQDHIAGFSKRDGSIFDLYECGVIIDFPLTNKTTQTYKNYVLERDEEVDNGAKHYTALDCYNNVNGGQRVFDLVDGAIKMEILYNYFYEHKTSDENDYSVCLQFIHGDRKFLFTGDLEEAGEQYLVQYNTLSKVELYKAGHHGSKTSSNDCLLNVITPEICVCCCCAGSVEYTQTFANTFPTQAFIDRISKHTERVYVPIMIEVEYNEEKQKYQNVEEYVELNGNVVVISNDEGVDVRCSNNDTLLKDTEWFKSNRTTPANWVN